MIGSEFNAKRYARWRAARLAAALVMFGLAGLSIFRKFGIIKAGIIDHLQATLQLPVGVGEIIYGLLEGVVGGGLLGAGICSLRRTPGAALGARLSAYAVTAAIGVELVVAVGFGLTEFNGTLSASLGYATGAIIAELMKLPVPGLILVVSWIIAKHDELSEEKSASAMREIATASEPITIQCAHGTLTAAVVCRHHIVAQDRVAGFIENSSDPDDLQAWCEDCEAFFEREGELTEEFKRFNDFAVVCVVCYSELKARHSR